MKLNCGPSLRERTLARMEAKENWHTWFAWYPVRIGKNCYWLQNVWRRGTQHYSFEGCYWAYDHEVNEPEDK